VGGDRGGQIESGEDVLWGRGRSLGLCCFTVAAEELHNARAVECLSIRQLFYAVSRRGRQRRLAYIELGGAIACAFAFCIRS